MTVSNLHRSVVLVLAMCVVCGCVGTRGYFTDRRRDALDTVTLTTGVGLGVKARVGPLAAGLFGNQDLAGLRCGEFLSAGVHEDLCGESEESLGMPIVAALELFGECMDVRVLDGDLGAWSGFDAELWMPPFESYFNAGSLIRERGKVESGRDDCIFVSVPDNGNAAYYSQIELAGGLLGTLRIGCNPGEFLDFVLGWGLLDIYGDDIELKRTTGVMGPRQHYEKKESTQLPCKAD